MWPDSMLMCHAKFLSCSGRPLKDAFAQSVFALQEVEMLKIVQDDTRLKTYAQLSGSCTLTLTHHCTLGVDRKDEQLVWQEVWPGKT